LKLFDLRPDERRATLWAALCYGFVLCSWFLVRPQREAFGIQRGAEDLPWLMMGTFIIALAINPLYARVLDRRSRRDALRLVYRFVQGNLVLFWAAFVLLGEAPEVGASGPRLWLGYGMYIWMSTFNLLMVSVFWSLCNEAMPVAGTRRAFGPAAAGGTIGAILGATCAKEITPLMDEPLHLLLLAALLLEGAVVCVGHILEDAPVRREAETTDPQPAVRVAFKGSAFSGFRDLLRSPYVLLILGYIGLHAVTGTWAYLIQGDIIASSETDPGARVALFASIDQATQGITLFLQLFVVTRLVGKRGVGRALAVLPLISAAGFVALFASPTYAVLLAAQALRRSTNYGLSKPSREMLFAVLGPEQKYKLKNLVDVAGYRGFDWLGAIAFKGMSLLGALTGTICLAASVLSGLWLFVTAALGRDYRQRTSITEDQEVCPDVP